MVLFINKKIEMLRVLSFFGLIIATSFYIFPFEFKALPGVNTKMAMAGLGLVCLFFNLAKKRNSIVNKQILEISLIALLVSLAGLFSIIYNNTNDTAYATYIISMWVWLGGAYFVILMIRKVHGCASIVIVGNYLIAACVMQCILAIMIDRVPAVFNIVNAYIGNFGVGGNVEGFEDSGRLYGIGAAVDFAGIRFVAVLIMIAYLVIETNNTIFRKSFPLYIISFIIITVIGNMMSRTTIIGTLFAIVYWLYMTKMNHAMISVNMVRLWKFVLGFLIVLIPLIVVLYHTNDFIYHNIRFAFEGFFSMVEKGYWETNSNNILKNMYRFPESFKTWVIGDGYFDNPTSDPYYIGYMWKGFYMGTDVGYLRFIFYFGLVGLLLIMGFMFKVVQFNIEKFPRYKIMFILLLFVNYIIWFKVSTDIFPILALLLIIDSEEDNLYMERVTLANQ